MSFIDPSGISNTTSSRQCIIYVGQSKNIWPGILFFTKDINQVMIWTNIFIIYDQLVTHANTVKFK